MSDSLDEVIESAITATYGFDELSLKHHLSAPNPVFACSEISMIANSQDIKGYDTIQVTIEKIVREL